MTINVNMTEVIQVSRTKVVLMDINCKCQQLEQVDKDGRSEKINCETNCNGQQSVYEEYIIFDKGLQQEE